MKHSIWTQTNNSTNFPALERELHTDVLIVGGGMCGVLCALILKQQGIDAVLLEAGRLGHGITKNTTAKITSQHGLLYAKLIRSFGMEKAGQYLRANEAALAKFRELCSEIDCSFEAKDAFVYSLSDRQKLEDEVKAVRSLGFPAEFEEDLPLPFQTVGAVRFPNQAQFHPLAFLKGVSSGLNIYENSMVKELKGQKAVTEHGSVTAKKIIAATHFPFINKHGSYFVKLFQQRSYVVALEQAQDVGGMYIDEAKNGLSFRNYDNQLLLGGGGHRTGKQGGGWAQLRTFAKQHYPAAVETAAWATQDCMSLDQIPYIGQYSKSTPDLYVAAGFNKWGMTSSMAAAMVLAELVQGKRSEFAEVFSPQRSILKPQLLVNAGEATMNLLTPRGPRCPHLGCALKWNRAERSWDCPCHGSRFEENGDLIDNPATGGAKV